ncbi:kinase-like domain-containing protein [Gongronella butleri]|nr:kinase-like domain-containing protein [Gongronella butleri]
MYKSKRSRPVSLSHTERLCDELREEQQRSNQAAARDFLEAMLGKRLGIDLQQELQDGVILCQVVNCIKPNTIATIGRKNTPFVKMANISLFLQGAEDVGLQKSQLFQTVDLYEGKDMTAVINTILTLARVSSTGTPTRRLDPVTARFALLEETNRSQARNHRHVKAIFEHHEPEMPAATRLPLALSLKRTPDSSLLATQSCNEITDRADQLRNTFRSIKTRDGALGTPPRSHLAPPCPNKDDDLHNDSGYSSITSRRHLNNGVATPTCIIDATALSDDEQGALSQFGLLTTHQPIVRKRFSSTSLASSIHTSAQLQSPQQPSQQHQSIQNTTNRYAFVDTLRSMSSNASTDYPTMLSTLSSSCASPSTMSTTQLTNATRSIPSRTASKPVPKLIRHRSDESLDVKHTPRQKQQQQQQQQRLTLRISMKRPGFSKRHTQFLLGDCIGTGQFGSVYRALDMSSGEIVAVKRILVEDGKLEQEMMKEVELLRGMSCPHIVRYIGFVQDTTYMNIVLEYVENGSLLSTVKAFGKLPEKLVGAYTYKILKGLEYLHDHDVVHCDLKAANILTTKTGDIKLTDFGVSMNLKIKKQQKQQQQGPDHGLSTPVGTPNWMAPEVIEMKGVGTKSDIWSLACTVIELLTGKPPYANLISMSVLYHIVEDPMPPLPSSLSKPVESFLIRCFQKNPEDRPTATELLQDPWLLPRAAQSLNCIVDRVTPTSTTKNAMTLDTRPSMELHNHLPDTTQHALDDGDKKVAWKASTSPFGLTTLEPNQIIISRPPTSPRTKLQRLFGIRKPTADKPSKRALYALPMSAKSVPNLSLSRERKSSLDFNGEARTPMSPRHAHQDSECIIS